MTSRAQRSTRRDLALVVGLTAVGGVVRFATLDARSFWIDEGLTAQLLRQDFGDMLATILATEATPPTYFLLVRWWAGVFGAGEVGLRSLSALLGTATVPVMYGVGLKLSGRRAAAIAALLTALNPMLVWQAQEARAYALMVLLSAISFLCFVSALRRPTARVLAGWSVSSALALATHYFAVYLVAVEAVWLLARCRSRQAVVLAVAGVAAVGAGLVPLVLSQRGQAAGWIEQSSLAFRIAQTGAEFVVGVQPPWRVASAAVATALAAAALISLVAWAEPDERSAARIPIVLGLVAMSLPVVLALVGFDRVYGRHLSAAWVPFCAALAIGFGVRRQPRIGAAALALLCLLWGAINVLTADDPKFGHQDWRAAAAALGPADRPRALVATPYRRRYPLEVYRPARPVPAAGGSVTEIVVIALPPKFRRLGQPSRPPRPPSPPAPPTFTSVERIEAPTFTLIRYRSPRPVHVTPKALERMALSSESIGVLVERPSGR